MQVTVKHLLPKAEAKQRLEKFSDKLKQQFPGDADNIKQTWDGDTCSITGKVKGFHLDCKLHVGDDEVVAQGDLPFFVRPFANPIESAVRNGIEQALA